MIRPLITQLFYIRPIILGLLRGERQQEYISHEIENLLHSRDGVMKRFGYGVGVVAVSRRVLDDHEKETLSIAIQNHFRAHYFLSLSDYGHYGVCGWMSVGYLWGDGGWR